MRYAAVNDVGAVVNPIIVDGQMHGGVVQGIGQALMESVRYDADGQPITGSYMDYAVPRAEDVPGFASASHPVPAKSNPLGVKGCGEAGCAGALASVMNAVVDALGECGVHHIDMPATPQRVWRAISRGPRRLTKAARLGFALGVRRSWGSVAGRRQSRRNPRYILILFLTFAISRLYDPPASTQWRRRDWL